MGSSSACVSYQRFHLGYVWMDVFTGRQAKFCPDVRPPVDGLVKLQDVLWVLDQIPTQDPRGNVNGDNVVTLADVVLVNGQVGALNGVCHP